MSQQLGITSASNDSLGFNPEPSVVIVKDIDMTIGAMCRFMVKWAIAAIPAAIILFFIFLLLTVVFGGIVRGVLFH